MRMDEVEGGREKKVATERIILWGIFRGWDCKFSVSG